ncbi:hypothetical protein Tco_0210900 [Tanacetum coccineum]
MNSWVNERQIQTAEDKVDTGKAVDASLVNTESIGTESKEQDTSSRSGNDAHADDADIRPIYDEEPMVEVQTTAEINIFATGQQHTEQPEFNNEGKVDQNVEQCHEPWAKLLEENKSLEKAITTEMFDSIKTIRAKNIEHTTSLIANNDKFKAQLQEKGFAIAALKNELRKLTGNSVNTNTTHYLPKEREYAVAKPHHMIAPGSSSSGLVLHQMTSDHNSLELGIHGPSNEQSRSKLVQKVVPPADIRQYITTRVGGIKFSLHTMLRRPYVLRGNLSRDSLNLPDHRIHKDGDGDASFQLKSDSLPHAHAQTTKTYYKHQDSRIMKA